MQYGELNECIRDWDGLGVFHRYDRPTSSHIFVAYHDSTLGPPAGGTRMRSYEDPILALRDAQRLAEAMTYKWAASDLPFGGGKCVVHMPDQISGAVRREFFLRYGRLLNSLRGSFIATVDMGTLPEDMDVSAENCEYIFGRVPGSKKSLDPGPYTALGVFEGIRAALEHRLGSADLGDVSIAIQGVGDVGAPLARLLSGAGAKILLSDLDGSRAQRVAKEVGGAVIPPDELYSARCAVFAPCAAGGVLDDESILELQCEVVAGSANNPLERPDHAELLHRREILFAPDYIISGGGAIAFGHLYGGVTDEDARRMHVRRIGDRLREVFHEAEASGELPTEAANRLVQRRLNEGGTLADAGLTDGGSQHL